MSKVLVIASGDLCLGFGLTGVETRPVKDVESAESALNAAVETGEYGIVIIDDQLLDGFDQRTRNTALAMTVPLVVAAPCDMKWRDVEDIPGDDYVARLIQRAIGYQLNVGV